MSAHSSDRPISDSGHSATKLSHAFTSALPGRPDVKGAVASVLRERSARAHDGSRAPAKQDAGEAEVITLLYGDASLRKRAFDTQPSHIWHAKQAPAVPGADRKSLGSEH